MPQGLGNSATTVCCMSTCDGYPPNYDRTLPDPKPSPVDNWKLSILISAFRRRLSVNEQVIDLALHFALNDTDKAVGFYWLEVDKMSDYTIR